MNRAIAFSIVLLAAGALMAACTTLPAVAPTIASTVAPPTPIPPTPLAPATVPLTGPPATSAPATSAAPQALVVCPILATRTPPPGAPTYVPGGPNPPRGPVDPHIEVCGGAPSVRSGETLTITAKPVDIGLPYYMLMIKDGEQPDYTQIVQVTYDNRIQGPTRASTLFELVSAKGSMYEATFVLRALSPGTATVVINATGEIHYGYPGPATYAGGGSDPVLVAVEK